MTISVVNHDESSSGTLISANVAGLGGVLVIICGGLDSTGVATFNDPTLDIGYGAGVNVGTLTRGTLQRQGSGGQYMLQAFSWWGYSQPTAVSTITVTTSDPSHISFDTMRYVEVTDSAGAFIVNPIDSNFNSNGTSGTGGSAPFGYASGSFTPSTNGACIIGAGAIASGTVSHDATSTTFGPSDASSGVQMGAFVQTSAAATQFKFTGSASAPYAVVGLVVVRQSASNVTAGLASGSGIAYGPIFGPGVTANAGTATGTGTVYGATGPVNNARPTAATGTGAAGDSTITNLGPAAGSFYANSPVANVEPSAGRANGTGAVLTVANSVSTNAQFAAGTGVTYNPTVVLGAITNVQANARLATGTGLIPSPVRFTLIFIARLATGTGVANPAFPSPLVPTAAGTGVAYNPTVTTGVPTVFKFECPSWDQIPQVAEEASPLSNRLMRFFKPRPMGRNIWTLPDGTLTFDEPWPLVDNSQATRDGLFPSTPPTLGSSWSNQQTVTYTHVYWGGHIYHFDFAIQAEFLEFVKLFNFLADQGYDPNDWLVPA